MTAQASHPPKPRPTPALVFPTIAGSIVIEHGIRLPPKRDYNGNGRQKLREALSGMTVGDSFVWAADNKQPYAAAKEIGCRIATRKLNGGGWRVWKVE